MEAGALRHYMAVQIPTRAKDSQGAPYQSWSTLYSGWFELRGLTGNERMQYGQVYANATHILWGRFNRGVKADCRLVWGNRYLYIVAPPEPDNKFIRMKLVTEDRAGTDA